MSVSEDAILKALQRVKGPDLEGNIVDLGLVGPPMIRDGKVYVSVTIDPARADELEPLRQAVEKVLAGVDGVEKATAVLTADRPSGSGGAPAPQAQQAPASPSPMAQPTAASGEHPKVTAAREARAQTAAAAGAASAQAKGPAQGRANGPAQNPSSQKSDRPQAAGVPGVKHLIAVASGKGGVGKSTTTVNLALALQQNGLKVGVLDADVFGPSQPRLLGLSGRPQVAHGNVLRPMEAYGIKAMSIGFLVDEAAPIIFRGPMVSSALQQMMRDVAWGELDVIVIDMPPGTGDVQLTMSQNVPLTGAVIVSTPQDLALIDARKGLNMFRKVDVPVLGIVENMSTFICPKCGERSDIFGHGGAREEADKLGVPFLGGVPLHMDIRARSDLGQPIVVTDPDGPHAKVYRDIADAVWSQVETAAADRQTAPLLTISNDRKSLVVTFEDATSFVLSAEMLRVMSPSAEVQGHSPEQRVTVGGKRNVAIRELRPVGNYAVRIVFDDGHDSGLYAWGYLKTLDAERETRWAAYEAELNEKGLTRG